MKVTDVPLQIVFDEVLILTVGVTAAFTAIVTALEVTVEVEAQSAFEVITQVTTSLFAKVEEAKVTAFVPEFEPLTFHWYEGVVPPFTGVAVKVTVFPLQILVEDAAIETDGVTEEFTVILIVFDEAVVGELHNALDVNTHEIASAFTSVVVEYEEAVAPGIFVPFFFHWKVGVPPPLVALAVKVTDVPEQTVVAEVLIVILGAVVGVTVIVTAFEVADVVVAQATLDVNTQVTTSLFASVVDPNVAEFVPTFPPFTFH